MPAYWRHLIIKSLLVGLVWQTHCVPTLPHGKIICISDQSGRTGANVEDTLYPMTPLTTNEVKAKAIETYSESDLRQFLEGNPDFYNFKSTIFTDLDRGNAMKDDYILLKNNLQNIKDAFHSYLKYKMSEADVNQVSKTIEKLEAFQKLIQKGIQNRIYEMKCQVSQTKEIGTFGIREDGPFNKRKKIASPSSETFFSRQLGLDLVEQIHHRVWDGEVDELTSILHGIPLHRENHQPIIGRRNELSLELQDLLFKQVGYMYKQKMLSGKAFKEFFQSQKTLEIAALAMTHDNQVCNTFSDMIPVTFLNGWTSEVYRNIYEVLDGKNKRYFSYISLKESSECEFYGIENLELESLFKDDKLFNTLENLVYPPSRNSYSRVNSPELIKQDPNYVTIQKYVQELISIFQDTKNQNKKWTRERSFCFLYFIQNHYGWEMLEVAKGENFEEKMSLMSSSLQLLREIDNIYYYLKEGEIRKRDIQSSKENKNGEEILMIYKLFQNVTSKHQSLFPHSEISEYCGTSKWNSEVKFNEKLITDLIDQHKYHFHKNP